jgi:hypothetical protein
MLASLSPPRAVGQCELIESLDRLLSTTTAEEWRGAVRWLNEWRVATLAGG